MHNSIQLTFLIPRLFKAIAVNLQINNDSVICHFATEKTNPHSFNVFNLSKKKLSFPEGCFDFTIHFNFCYRN